MLHRVEGTVLNAFFALDFCFVCLHFDLALYNSQGDEVEPQSVSLDIEQHDFQYY